LGVNRGGKKKKKKIKFSIGHDNTVTVHFRIPKHYDLQVSILSADLLLVNVLVANQIISQRFII